MDFLDPLIRRKRRRKLIISYILLAITLSLGTLVLVLAVNGYWINPRTGDIVQNGLIFVQTKPSGADIAINGTAHHDATPSRLVLPGGDYNLRLTRSGYQPWQRSFALKEQTVLRLDYAILIPSKLSPKTIVSYSSLPQLATASPDHHHLLVSTGLDSKGRLPFADFDTNHPGTAAKNLSVPGAIFTKSATGKNQLTVIEWSNDNRHLLLRHSLDSGFEFVMLDRSQPAESINLNKKLGLNPSSVSLRDRNANQLYVFTSAKGQLQQASLSPTTVAKPFLSGINNYATSGSDTVFYSLPRSESVAISIWQNNRNYRLATLDSQTKPLLAAASFQGHAYFVVGVSDSQWLSLYKDPLSILSKPTPPKVDAHVTLKLPAVASLSFSPTSRFFKAEDGQKLVSYDLQTDLSYHFSRQTSGSLPLGWTDNYHLTGTDNGRAALADYDGANFYHLNATAGGQGLWLANDLKGYWAFGTLSKKNSTPLQYYRLAP